MKSPMVSIVMAAYNAQEYLNIAIDSILLQSYKDFELIIIDDGSSDQTGSIVKSYNDHRIKYFYQENQGLSAALNAGINKASGKYFARMDADDVSYPNRLKKQVAFMEKAQKAVLLGSSFDVIDLNGCVIDRSYHLLDDQDLQLEFLVRNPFGHGTVIAKREAVIAAGGYYKDEPIEDYEFWWRLSKQGEVYNLPDRLYGWRVNPDGMSHGSSDKRQPFISKLMQRIWGESHLRLPTPTEISKTLGRYAQLDEADRFVEQYGYMLASVTLTLLKKKPAKGLALLARLTLAFPRTLPYIANLRRHPASHNYNLRNL